MNKSWASLTIKIKSVSAINKEVDLRSSKGLIIIPHSKFLIGWTLILGIAVAYNLVMVPFDIAFGSQFEECSYDSDYADLAFIIIYFFDIIVHANTAIKLRNNYIFNKEYLYN